MSQEPYDALDNFDEVEDCKERIDNLSRGELREIIEYATQKHKEANAEFEDFCNVPPVDGESTEDYKDAILSLARLGGYDKSLPPEKKRALKEQAASFLRDNPA
jgi:hypothetical protein